MSDGSQQIGNALQAKGQPRGACRSAARSPWSARPPWHSRPVRDRPVPVKGWTFKTIIQGSSVPQQFIPRLIALWSQDRFPLDKMIRTYELDDINLAFSDSATGETVKPVVVH